MGNGKRYDQKYKNMIVNVFKSGMSLTELISEYVIAKSTIKVYVNDVNEVITLKEVKALKKKMEKIKAENEI